MCVYSTINLAKDCMLAIHQQANEIEAKRQVTYKGKSCAPAGQHGRVGYCATAQVIEHDPFDLFGNG